MNAFQNRSAIVTGAASGIGLALSQALSKRGARVFLTDVDGDACESAAKSIGDGARALTLDVRDGEAFARVVDHVAEEAGGLGLLFNNAGIGLGGETQDLSTAHFDRIIDINIRGVTNGVAAAYPRMVRQGSGHIVNTASAAGLLPIPLMTPYAMSKFAVVGLSESLRLEARRHGVRVSALCPSAIETPILDTEGPDDLPKSWRPDIRRYLTRLAGPPFPSDAFAEYALDAIAAGRGLIVAPRSARLSAFLHRLLPRLVEARVRAALDGEIAER